MGDVELGCIYTNRPSRTRNVQGKETKRFPILLPNHHLLLHPRQNRLEPDLKPLLRSQLLRVGYNNSNAKRINVISLAKYIPI